MTRLPVRGGVDRDAHTSIRRRTRREEQVGRSIRVDFGGRGDREAHTSIRRRTRREEQVGRSILKKCAFLLTRGRQWPPHRGVREAALAIAFLLGCEAGLGPRAPGGPGAYGPSTPEASPSQPSRPSQPATHYFCATSPSGTLCWPSENNCLAMRDSFVRSHQQWTACAPLSGPAQCFLGDNGPLCSDDPDGCNLIRDASIRQGADATPCRAWQQFDPGSPYCAQTTESGSWICGANLGDCRFLLEQYGKEGRCAEHSAFCTESTGANVPRDFASCYLSPKDCDDFRRQAAANGRTMTECAARP
jgi:hypothetical protein